MKSTGIVQTVDDMGKILIPKIITKNYGISKDDSVEVTCEDERIILKKIEQGCVFCGKENELKEFMGKHICEGCKNDIS